MNIDRKDFERVLSKTELPIEKKRITDLPKYTYWHIRSSEYIDAMNENNDDFDKYKENFHHGLLCELEKYKYARITKKELILLITLLKYHNSIHKDKLYCDNKGLRVKRYDRRAVRVDTVPGEFSKS